MNTVEVDIPAAPSHRWEWIKFQLRLRGTSLADIARTLKVTGSAVKNAKHLPYPRVERAIASALGLSPALIWPERWLSKEQPKRCRPGRGEAMAGNAQENTPAYDLGHRKTGTEK
ncbi:helix-turn-helix domain-containing protein [Ectopseudomonas mendocina]|uniref:Nucleotide excision repair protein n=1 Tax=Ectopseudomonas mendocina TaxID=300 RepID=A0A2R3QX10_ECTME|nr:helix-turn-helix domain-containing protein [Pseudomonas mendocina]AVO56286.1 nucleotide excision repair protein [Pseudomonas mendocina]